VKFLIILILILKNSVIGQVMIVSRDT